MKDSKGYRSPRPHGTRRPSPLSLYMYTAEHVQAWLSLPPGTIPTPPAPHATLPPLRGRPLVHFFPPKDPKKDKPNKDMDEPESPPERFPDPEPTMRSKVVTNAAHRAHATGHAMREQRRDARRDNRARKLATRRRRVERRDARERREQDPEGHSREWEWKEDEDCDEDDDAGHVGWTCAELGGSMLHEDEQHFVGHGEASDAMQSVVLTGPAWAPDFRDVAGGSYNGEIAVSSAPTYSSDPNPARTTLFYVPCASSSRVRKANSQGGRARYGLSFRANLEDGDEGEDVLQIPDRASAEQMVQRRIAAPRRHGKR